MTTRTSLLLMQAVKQNIKTYPSFKYLHSLSRVVNCHSNSPEIRLNLTPPIRAFASKRHLKGSDKKKKVTVDELSLSQVIDLDKLKNGLEHAMKALQDDYRKQLSLRTAGGVIEDIKVTYEGEEYELQQISRISRKGQQTIIVDMISFPQMSKAVVDTLKSSKLNLNPQQEGTTIYIPIPKVTKEHREILAKKAKEIFIVCRDTMKKHQEKSIRLLKDGDVSDHELLSLTNQIRALVDGYIQKVELAMKTKQEELLKSS